MNKGQVRLAIGMMALVGVGVGVGVVIGAVVTRMGIHKNQESQAESLAPIKEVATLDSNRALRDLLGTTSDGALRQVKDQRAEFWRNHDFAHGGSNYHVVFFAMKPIDSKGELETCIECAPVLAAVTYRKDASTWEVAARDLFLTQLGRYGELPPANNAYGTTFGAVPAMVIPASDAEKGYVDEAAHLFAYNNGWRYLSGFVTGEDNMKSSDCVLKQRCYSWRGTLKVLRTGSDGFPDLVLERQGTRQDVPGGKILPAGASTYQFMEAMYREKDTTPPPAPIQAHTPAMQQPSGTPSSSGGQWYAADVNSTRCLRSRSPAERIRMIQENGNYPKITDLPNGAVEVAEQTKTYEEQVWKYYPNEEACVAALPRSQNIPSRYK